MLPCPQLSESIGYFLVCILIFNIFYTGKFLQAVKEVCKKVHTHFSENIVFEKKIGFKLSERIYSSNCWLYDHVSCNAMLHSKIPSSQKRSMLTGI